MEDDDDGREEGESSPKFELVQCGVHGGGESGTCPCRHQSATIDETRYTLCTVTRVLVETFSCALIGYTTVPFLLLAVPLRHSIKPASCPLVHFDLACPHFGVTPPDREYPPTLSSLHHPQPP